MLHADEVQALNLEGTELVVLSACDTGQGAPDYSEGLEGLPRAFRVAGAKNVLVALWPIGDEPARDFMERFYARWLAQEVSDPARRRPPPHAARRAQVHRRAAPRRYV